MYVCPSSSVLKLIDSDHLDFKSYGYSFTDEVSEFSLVFAVVDVDLLEFVSSSSFFYSLFSFISFSFFDN